MMNARSVPLRLIAGAKVRASSFFRPTTLSIAMADAGLIPDVHLVGNLSATAIVRHRNDNLNRRKSVFIAF